MRRDLGGGTRVYRIGPEKYQLLHSYGWYSPGLAIRCGGYGPRGRASFSLVRMGRGWKSELGEKSTAVTLAFYLGGKVLAEYSRIDIALLSSNRCERFTPKYSPKFHEIISAYY